jgi:hypothetical protein
MALLPPLAGQAILLVGLRLLGIFANGLLPLPTLHAPPLARVPVRVSLGAPAD